MGQAAAVVYGPFLAMALYTLLFVPCPHCKRTVWETLPISPGLPLSWLALSRIGYPHTLVAVCFASAALTLLMVTAVACALRQGGRLKWPMLIAAILVASGLAIVNLQFIRA